jgi:hypothetical protein
LQLPFVGFSFVSLILAGAFLGLCCLTCWVHLFLLWLFSALEYLF